MIADLVQRLRLVEPPVDHDHPDALRVPDVLERVAIEHNQISKLTLFERSKLPVEPEILCAVERRAADRLEVGHATLLEHPQLPVRPHALELSVRAELDRTARIQDLLH